MSWIDDIGYPWHLPIAQQVHRNAMKAKPDKRMARDIAQRAGIDTDYIDTDQAVAYVWKDLLQYASSNGQLRDLLKELLQQLNDKHPYHPFFKNILDSGLAAIEAEPVDAQGKPEFITGDDDITEQESLLYSDDLTLPFGKLRALIQTLQKLETIAPAVCRLVVSINNDVKGGTGFRIGQQTILTNHHVFHKKTGERATAVTAQFGYVDDGEGGFENGTNFKCDIGSIQSNKQSDWAIIITNDALPATIPIIDLNSHAAAKINDQAFIIQHPLGGTKKLGYVRNSVSYVDGIIAHYLTDTQQGSSGAPVFNGHGQLIAVHRAGGRPIELAGQQPMKKNEGILISKILEELGQQQVQVV